MILLSNWLCIKKKVFLFFFIFYLLFLVYYFPKFWSRGQSCQYYTCCPQSSGKIPLPLSEALVFLFLERNPNPNSNPNVFPSVALSMPRSSDLQQRQRVEHLFKCPSPSTTPSLLYPLFTLVSCIQSQFLSVRELGFTSQSSLALQNGPFQSLIDRKRSQLSLICYRGFGIMEPMSNHPVSVGVYVFMLASLILGFLS